MKKAVCCVIEDGEETKKQAEGDNDLDTEQPESKIFWRLSEQILQNRQCWPIKCIESCYTTARNNKAQKCYAKKSNWLFQQTFVTLFFWI